MATADKTKNSAQRSKRKVQETARTVAGQDNVPAEGKADMKDNLKQAGYVPDETADHASSPIPKARIQPMATIDKAKNTAQRAKGEVKEAAGKVTGDAELQAKGKADQRKGNLKQAGEKFKDAVKK